MAKLYISTEVEKAIRQYCELNGIKDILEFANKCTLQGLNTLKYGISPTDNARREKDGEVSFRDEGKKSMTTVRRIKPIKKDNQ